MNNDNPAGRLLAILQAGVKHEGSENCRAVWQQLLETKEENEMMSRMGKVMDLPAQITRALVESHPHYAATPHHWAKQVNAAFMVQNVHGEWKTFAGNIDHHTLTYLSMLSDLLQAKSNTKLVAGDALVQCRADLDRILQDILVSDAPDGVKKYVARNIRKILIAIDEYRLTGALLLLEEVESTVGHALFDPQYDSFLRETPLGKQLLETLAAVANVVTVAVGLPQVGEWIGLLAQRAG